jgi:uncharacterized protein YggU (UPF0235/DUF167 family)
MSESRIAVRLQPRRVSVARGERSRDKLVVVEGIEPAALAAALSAS